MYKTKQIYYTPYTDFKYNIFVYLDDILKVEWNINVNSKVFEVQPTTTWSRLYLNGRQKR